MKLIRDRIVCPFTIGVDCREKHPFTFTGIEADGAAKGKTLLVPTEVLTLKTGDYTIVDPDLSAGLSVERKSLSDFIGTIARQRDRFKSELARLDGMVSAHIVVESDWDQIVHRCHEFTRAPAKSIHRSVIAWTIKYPKVHWHLCSNRFLAERTCFRILQKFWQRHRENEA